MQISQQATRSRGSMARYGAAAVLVALVVAGCSPAAQADPVEPVVQSLAPTPAPAPTAVVDVPVTSSSLAAAAVPETVAPVSLTIPTLGIAIPIDPVGVEDDGQMQIPPLAERAGWYRYGAAPGQAEGTAVVAAHVDSIASAALGPFAQLGKLVVGDVVEVALADGGAQRYSVTGVSSVPKTDVQWPDVFTRDGAHRLVLVTCGGDFRRDARSYTDNVIVTADPIGA